MQRRRINGFCAPAGQRVGAKEVDGGMRTVGLQYDLGYIDLEQKSLHFLKRHADACYRTGCGDRMRTNTTALQTGMFP